MNLLQEQWTPGKMKTPQPKVFTIQPNSEAFTAYFDKTQEQLETLASMDDLLSGRYIQCTSTASNFMNFIDDAMFSFP